MNLYPWLKNGPTWGRLWTSEDMQHNVLASLCVSQVCPMPLGQGPPIHNVHIPYTPQMLYSRNPGNTTQFFLVHQTTLSRQHTFYHGIWFGKPPTRIGCSGPQVGVNRFTPLSRGRCFANLSPCKVSQKVSTFQDSWLKSCNLSLPKYTKCHSAAPVWNAPSPVTFTLFFVDL